MGGKGDSIPHSQWANHRCEDCGRIAGQVSPAGAARNHLATRGPASTDHSAAGSGGVGTASRTTSRAKFANGCDGRFLAAPSRSHVLPLADARPHASPPLRLHCLAVTYRVGCRDAPPMALVLVVQAGSIRVDATSSWSFKYCSGPLVLWHGMRVEKKRHRSVYNRSQPGKEWQDKLLYFARMRLKTVAW